MQIIPARPIKNNFLYYYLNKYWEKRKCYLIIIKCKNHRKPKRKTYESFSKILLFFDKMEGNR